MKEFLALIGCFAIGSMIGYFIVTPALIYWFF